MNETDPQQNNNQHKISKYEAYPMFCEECDSKVLTTTTKHYAANATSDVHRLT
jgi:hypothetical protein